MEQESKEGRENGGESDTKDTKEGENTQTADKEVAEKLGVERDTGNGVAPNVADDIETDTCQGPEAKPGKENTSEEPSKKVQSESDSAQPTVESQLPENASDVETTAGEEVKEPYDEAQNVTEDKNIAQGKANQTNASNSEEQSDPDSSQADSGTDRVETSRTVQDQDGGPPQTDADSPSELAGNKGGISNSNLEKLANALMVADQSGRSLGLELGFSRTNVFHYCGYGKPKDSSGILCMLRAWKDKTPDAKRISGLLEALMNANLRHLADDLDLQEGAEEQREAVQTSDGDSVTSPSKSVQPTTTRSDPLTDNRKSSPPVVPGAGPDPNNEDAPRKGSGKTDEGESNEPQIAGSSSETKDTKPETVPRNPTTNPTTPDRNSGSKDPNDNEEAMERKTKETSEEEKRDTENKANEQKVSKDGAAASKDATKEDGTPKQKAKEEVVEAGGTEDVEESFEHMIKERPVSISVCTSAYEFNVQGLVSFLEDHKKDHPELIKEVKFHALPYNDLDHYTFPKDHPVDVMLLCHSINNRRFAITDVMDALYDKYLPYCASVVGKDKMGVIVHDFEDMRETVQSSRMGSFRYKQPKAFETTSLQIICGHIEKKEQVLKQMQKADREKLLEFLKKGSNLPEEMTEQVPKSQSRLQKGVAYFESKWESFKSVGRSQDSTAEGSSVDRSEAHRNDHGVQGKGTSGGAHQTPQVSRDELNLNPPRDAPYIGQQMSGTSTAPAAADIQVSHGQQSMASRMTVTSAQQTSPPRHISISVCSSAHRHNVEGFMSKLNELQAGQPHMIADVSFRTLPYNDIDSFRFPPNDPVDVMVLCHSVQNRGFSITNVMNALYEKYLQYCHDIIGKKKLAVIVHDFSDCKPKTLDVRMDSFKRSQPLAFELVDTVIVCGSLEKPGKIEMTDEDMTKLLIFFERARFEPKDDQSSWKSSVVNWFCRKNSTDK